MRHDELIVSTLRVSSDALHELVAYLEAKPGLNLDEVLYSEHRVVEAMRQLKAVRRLLSQRRHAQPLSATLGLFWN